MSAITITVVIVYFVTVLEASRISSSALGRGELGLVEDPRSYLPPPIPHRAPAGTDVCRPGVWPEIPFLLKISLAQPS